MKQAETPLDAINCHTYTYAIGAALGLLTMLVSPEGRAESGEPQDCSASNAVEATVRQIASNPMEYIARCVNVLGVMRGVDLFEDVDGVYLEPADTLDPSSDGAQIGLDNLGKRYSEDYQHVAIIGRVQDCEEARACAQASAGPDSIVMVAGYCHMANGAYIWIEELRRRKGRPFERQMGSVARPGYGDLIPAPPDWIHRAKIASLANEFLEVVQAEDAERLLALHYRNVGLDWEDEEAELVRFILKDRSSPFREFRNRLERPQTEIFVRRESLDLEGERGSSNYQATVCFCREADCSGRWPIATFDADNLRTRPYVCTTIDPYFIGRTTVPHFTTALGKVGLAEPKRRDSNKRSKVRY